MGLFVLDAAHGADFITAHPNSTHTIHYITHNTLFLPPFLSTFPLVGQQLNTVGFLRCKILFSFYRKENVRLTVWQEETQVSISWKAFGILN